MAIYGKRLGTNNIAGLLSNVAVNPNAQTGDLLIWHDDLQQFVLETPKQSNISSTSTYGGLGVNTVNGGIVNGDLRFKEIVAGSNILIDQTTSALQISAVTTNALSVDGDMRLTIDNDNNNPQARLELYSAFSTVDNPVTIDYSPAATIINAVIYTGNHGTRGYFESKNAIDFVASGFVTGMWLNVEGLEYQSGDYEIDEVITWTDGTDTYSRIYTTVKFVGPAGYGLGGPYPNVQLLALTLYSDKTTNSLKTTTGMFDQMFESGMILNIDNSEFIDGTYTIDSVTPNEIVFVSTTQIPRTGTVIAPSLSSPNVTIDVQYFESSTGVWFDKQGVGHVNTLEIENAPTADNHATNKEYVDEYVKENSSSISQSYFMSFF